MSQTNIIFYPQTLFLVRLISIISGAENNINGTKSNISPTNIHFSRTNLLIFSPTKIIVSPTLMSISGIKNNSSQTKII